MKKIIEELREEVKSNEDQREVDVASGLSIAISQIVTHKQQVIDELKELMKDEYIFQQVFGRPVEYAVYNAKDVDHRLIGYSDELGVIQYSEHLLELEKGIEVENYSIVELE